MTRAEVLTSGDGGTTLSLARDASIMRKISPSCPGADSVDPTVSDPLPRYPTPPDVNGQDHDDTEEGASMLLPANRRKVNAKVIAQERQTNGHRQKKTLSQIMSGGFVFGLKTGAQEGVLARGQNQRWGHEFEAVSHESEDMKGATGAGASNRKHEEVSHEGAERMAENS